MKIISYSLIIFFYCLSSFGQNDTLKGEYLHVTSDAIGKFWIYNDTKLNVVDSTGSLMFENSSLGIPITKVDCSEAMKVLVFSEALQTYLFVDNTGSRIGDQMLFPRELSYVSHLCKASNDGGMWAIDEDNAALVKLDASGGLVFQKFGLDKIVGELDSILDIDEEDRKVYIRTTNAVYQYNEFGVFEDSWLIEDLTVGFQVVANGFIVKSNTEIRFQSFLGEVYTQQINGVFLDFRISHGKFFGINKDGTCVIINFSKESYHKKN